jgi:transposase
MGETERQLRAMERRLAALEMREQGMKYREVGKKLGVSAARAAQLVMHAQAEKENPRGWDAGIPTALRNVMSKAGIESRDDALSWIPTLDANAIGGIGMKRLKELREWAGLPPLAKVPAVRGGDATRSGDAMSEADAHLTELLDAVEQLMVAESEPWTGHWRPARIGFAVEEAWEKVLAIMVRHGRWTLGEP